MMQQEVCDVTGIGAAREFPVTSQRLRRLLRERIGAG
jgi:hypothetical protein